MGENGILKKLAEARLEKVSKEVIKLEDYKKFSRQIEAIGQKIKDTYPQEVWEMFLEIDSLISTENYVEIELAYTQGLKDGLNLMLEAKEIKPCVDF